MQPHLPKPRGRIQDRILMTLIDPPCIYVVDRAIIAFVTFSINLAGQYKKARTSIMLIRAFDLCPLKHYARAGLLLANYIAY
jgi:hypothetical protein